MLIVIFQTLGQSDFFYISSASLVVDYDAGSRKATTIGCLKLVTIFVKVVGFKSRIAGGRFYTHYEAYPLWLDYSYFT